MASRTVFVPPVSSILDMCDTSPLTSMITCEQVTCRLNVSSNSAHVSESSGQEFARHRTRSDQPRVIYNTRASKDIAMEAASTQDTMNEAIMNLENDFHAASTKASRSSCLNTWLQFHHAWFQHEDPFPLTKDKIIAIAALFKKGKYKSFPNYLSRVKEEHVKAGFAWDDILDRISRDASRSVVRGLAPKQRSDSLDFIKAMGRCMRVGCNTAKLTAPFAPYAMICFGTMFLCREIELSGSLAPELCFDLLDMKVRFKLPASKMDIRARGVERELGCLCDITEFCPAHLARRYLKELKDHFVAKKGMTWHKLPLFPKADGSAMTKTEVVNMLRFLVKSYGGRLEDEAGRSCISGHALRITGARLFSSWGVDPITIGLHGRWSSSAIMSYIAESPLTSLTSRIVSHPSLQNLHNRVTSLERKREVEFLNCVEEDVDKEVCDSSSSSSS